MRGFNLVKMKKQGQIFQQNKNLNHSNSVHVASVHM